jgi:methyl coenzyme M reductase alpha subunit
MALTENKQIDRVEVIGNGIIQVREVTTILKDGVDYAKTFHRWSFVPESDISAMPANVQAIAQAAWTPEVIAAYKAQVEANRRGVSE